jgi:hypothetical protein
MTKDRYDKRKQWFINHIGKRIYRTKNSCQCEICKAVYEHGLFVDDRMQAIYCHDAECELGVYYFSRKWKARLMQIWITIKPMW